MLTKDLALKLLSLVNSDQWKVMEEYLQKKDEVRKHELVLEAEEAKASQARKAELEAKEQRIIKNQQR